MDRNLHGSVHLCFPSFFSMLFIKDAGLDENYQVGGPEGYHELSHTSSLSLDPEDKILNNGKCSLAGPSPSSDEVGGRGDVGRDASFVGDEQRGWRVGERSCFRHRDTSLVRQISRLLGMEKTRADSKTHSRAHRMSLQVAPGNLHFSPFPKQSFQWASGRLVFGRLNRNRAAVTVNISNTSGCVPHIDLSKLPNGRCGVCWMAIFYFYHPSLLINWDSGLRKSLPFINMHVCAYLNVYSYPFTLINIYSINFSTLMSFLSCPNCPKFALGNPSIWFFCPFNASSLWSTSLLSCTTRCPGLPVLHLPQPKNLVSFTGELNLETKGGCQVNSVE